MGAVLNATWIEHHELQTQEEVRAFAGFAAHLMSEGRNEGETAVLAVATTMPALAVLDDSAAHNKQESPASAPSLCCAMPSAMAC